MLCINPYISRQCLLSMTLSSTSRNFVCNLPPTAICPQPVATQRMPRNVSVDSPLLIGRHTGDGGERWEVYLFSDNFNNAAIDKYNINLNTLLYNILVISILLYYIWLLPMSC